MKVMHIGNVQREANGVGQVIKELSQAQQELGHEVVTLTARHKQDELPSFVEVHTNEDFKALLDRFQPDIFVFHSLYIWEYIKFYPILKKRKIPFLLELHGALSEENYRKSHFKKVVANFIFYKRFIKSAKRIIYLNQGELKKSIVKYINPNSAIVPNGCHKPNIIPKLRDSSDGKIEFLYLGRIELYHKGIDVLLEAISKIKDSGYADKIHFTFYGIGEEDHLSKFKEKLIPLKEIAEFRGPAYGKDKEQAYQNADYFILTSRFEGMPMSILEALSYGRPCFITPATNMGEIITEFECGIVSELNSDRLAQDIINVACQYGARKRILFDNSLKAANAYHWNEIAKRSIELYSSVLAKL